MARSETSADNKNPSSEELAAQLEALRSEVSALATTMGEIGRTGSAALGDAARDSIHRAQSLAQDGVEAARAQAVRLEGQANDFVTRQPATALSIAAGLGFVVGMITARR